MNLILDVDHTLTTFDKNYRIHARPYLTEFLALCFKHFATVSLWTAAEKSWFSQVEKTCLTPTLREMNWRYNVEGRWHFIMTREDMPHSNASEMTWNERFKKDLQLVWKTKPEFTAQNTLIVEDNPDIALVNPRNYVLVAPYHLTEALPGAAGMASFSPSFISNPNSSQSMGGVDLELYLLSLYFEKLSHCYDVVRDIQVIEKSSWRLTAMNSQELNPHEEN